MEATNVAATDALFASVNPSVSKGTPLNQILLRAIDSVASMQSRTPGVRRAFYAGLTKASERIQGAGEGDRIDFDMSGLKTLLFGPDAEVEAVRLLKADAIVAIAKASTALASQIRAEVLALKDDEKSSIVRDRLAMAPLPKG